MIDNVNCQLKEKNEPQQGAPLSHQSFVELDDSSALPNKSARLKFRSRSLDDLELHRQSRCQRSDDDHVSNTTRTEMDLTGIGCPGDDLDIDEKHSDTNDEYDLQPQRSQSAPVSPTQFYDKELAAFIQCEQQQQQMMADSFVYNIDLSDGNETGAHQTHLRTAIFFEDDDHSPFDDTPYDPVVNIVHSCLPITEENEEELEQLRRDADEEEEEDEQNRRNHLLKINDGSIPTVTLHDNDDRADILENDDDQITESEAQILIMNTSSSFDPNQDIEKRLSTIYESPSPQPRTEEEEEEDDDGDEGEYKDDIYDEAYDRLIVYDIANIEKPSTISPKSEAIKSPSLSYRSPILDRTRIRSCYTDASFKPCPTFTNTVCASRLCGTSSVVNSKVFTPPFLHLQDKSSPSPVTINAQNSYINKSLASLPTDQQSPSKSTPMSLSVPILLLPNTGEQSSCPTDNPKMMPSQHIQTMKVIQSTSSSLSDFIIPTTVSAFNNTTHYEEVSSVHHSLTDCSSVPHISCGVMTLEGEPSTTSKSCEDNQRRPSFTRRILTNGLLLSHCSHHHAHQRRAQPPLTFNQHRQQTKPKSEEKLSTLSSPIGSSSSSSESSSPAGEKFMSRSDFILQQQQQQQQQNISQQRKASSLKTISATASQQPSKILYPIDFENNNNEDSWYQKQSSSNAAHQNKVPTSDSGIVIDTAVTRPTSNTSIEDNDVDGIPLDITSSGKLKQYESNYRKALADLTIIKKNIVEIESRLSEAMRELEIERALVEGEHELVFKQILDDSEADQDKIRHLYNELQLLTERIMTEKTSIRNEIEYTQQVLYKLEYELRELEEQYRPTDDKILKKKELLVETRRKHEDLEFQLMELETRCEAELEQAEEQFQREQILVAQNSKLRQNTLRDLDHQQNIILHQVIIEKEKLEREKQKLKLLFKQKKLEASELEQRLNGMSIHPERKIYENTQQLHAKDVWVSGNGTMYHSSPSNLYSALSHTDRVSTPKINLKDTHQEKLDEIKEMIAVAKLEKMTILEQQLRERYDELVQCHDEHLKRVELEQKLANEIQNRDYLIERQVKLREKNRMQERPLTRYLPIRSVDFDLRAHIEGAGHMLDSSHIHITATSCRGFLLKMGGMKFKTWNRRWFVFDRKRRSLFYYQDKTETKLRGCIYFQSIVEVYVDHLQSISMRSPEPREATFIVKTIERPYYLVAPTVEAMRIWVDVIITGAEGNTFAGES